MNCTRGSKPMTVAAGSKVSFRGRLSAGIVFSNSTGGLDVCLLWVLLVVRYRSLRRADHSSRGVLPSAACQSVFSKPQQRGGLGPLGLSSHGEEIRQEIIVALINSWPWYLPWRTGKNHNTHSQSSCSSCRQFNRRLLATKHGWFSLKHLSTCMERRGSNFVVTSFQVASHPYSLGSQANSCGICVGQSRFPLSLLLYQCATLLLSAIYVVYL